MVHVPVMLDEVVRLLAPRPGEVYVDCTAGLGGHAEAVARVVGAGGVVVLNDADGENLGRAAARVRSLVDAPRLVEYRGNFAEVPARLEEAGIVADMMLADLGFASPQVEAPERGFSFSRDGPLDMRLDVTQSLTAEELVNTLPEAEIARMIRDFGEDRAASRIARKIVQERAKEPIRRTTQLAEIVRSAVGGSGGIHPATRTFQALRIAVNDEIGSLEALLGAIESAAGKAGRFLRAGSRVAMIAFHSLEDRPVKMAFAELVRAGKAEDVSDGGVRASEAEVDGNPRSRSATLRVIRMV